MTIRVLVTEATRNLTDVKELIDTVQANILTTIYTALRCIDTVKVALAPIVPFVCERVHHYLGYDDRLFGDLTVVEYQEATRAHQALVQSGESIASVC